MNKNVPFLSPCFFADLMAMHYGIAVFVKDLLEGSIIMLLTFWNRFNVCDAAVCTGSSLAFGRELMCFCSQKHTIQSGSPTIASLLSVCSCNVLSALPAHTNKHTSQMRQTGFPLLIGKVPGKWEDSQKAAKSNNNGAIHMHVILCLSLVHDVNLHLIYWSIKVLAHWVPHFCADLVLSND